MQSFEVPHVLLHLFQVLAYHGESPGVTASHWRADVAACHVLDTVSAVHRMVCLAASGNAGDLEHATGC